MKLRHTAPLLAAAALAAACAAGGSEGSGAAAAAPADFAVAYHWSNGALPPPYHYSYSVHLGPGSGGRIEFRPGYDSTAWTERFAVTRAQLDSLHAALRERGVFDREWPEGPPIAGGPAEYLDATAGGRRVRLPSMPRDEDRAALRGVYAAVRALVPPEVLRGLEERRERESGEREP